MQRWRRPGPSGGVVAFLVSARGGCYIGIFATCVRKLLGAISQPCNHLQDISALSRVPDIRPYRGKFPQIAASAYIDPAAIIIGDVAIGEDSSIWPRTVVRGDVHYIRIGNRTNVQDGCVLHVMKDQYPLVLGDDVTVGHSVTLHGCTIEGRVLVGMGCIILNGAVVGRNSIIAAGTLITERTVIPSGSLVLGSPGKVKRPLNEKELASIEQYSVRYAGYREIYRREAEERGERIDWSGLSGG